MTGSGQISLSEFKKLFLREQKHINEMPLKTFAKKQRPKSASMGQTQYHQIRPKKFKVEYG